LHFLLLTIGSHGDVHPFVGLGITLRKRGHRVSVATNEHFKSLVERAELDFLQLGTDEDFVKAKSNPDIWDWKKGAAIIFQLIAPLVRQGYEIVVKHATSDTVVVASSLGFGARIAQDKHGFSTATVHLSPAVLRSIVRPPKLPGAYMPRWLPRSIVRRMFAVGDRYMVDPLIGPAINELRAELGLPAVSGIFRDYLNSPQLVIGMFPEWFAPPSDDWPKQVRLTGFPLFDEAELEPMSSKIYDFINAGDAPIVFTPGSANVHAHEFFASAVEACQRLGMRGVLMSRHRDHVPRNLPSTVAHFEYAPFGQLFPHAAAVVHHGGIGTSAQALAAGTRQLITPMSHDQPDNAARLMKLGVARAVASKSLTTKKLTGALDWLLSDREYGIRAHWVSQWFKGQQPLTETAELLEAMGGATAFPPLPLGEGRVEGVNSKASGSAATIQSLTPALSQRERG
jgi:rhamnosyltransferase subunit B